MKYRSGGESIEEWIWGVSVIEFGGEKGGQSSGKME